MDQITDTRKVGHSRSGGSDPRHLDQGRWPSRQPHQKLPEEP